MATLTINGTAVPEPEEGGITVTEEIIWSANTGRSTGAKMIGDIVARKTTVDVTWPRLTITQVSLIETAISSKPFFPVRYKDARTKQYVTKIVYSGALKKPHKTTQNGIEMYDGVSVTLIEQ